MRLPTSPIDPAYLRPTVLALACTVALAACSSSDDDSSPTDDGPGPDTTPGMTASGVEGTDTPAGSGERFAFVAGALAGTGQIERLAFADDFASTGVTPSTTSDIRVATDGTDVYEIGRFNLDTLTRFRTDDLETPVWQYSANGAESTVNPYEIVFVDETKAYVVRYGSSLVWIVDPSATTLDAFKTGEIDLSAYNDNAANGDMTPNPSDAVLVGDQLYVLMERLGGTSGFDPDTDGYVAVIDTETDTEIDTDPTVDGLPGIALESSNPGALLYPEGSDVVYVVGRGNIFNEFNSVPGDPYDGGIETIDTVSYARTLLIDDGTMDENEGFFANAIVASNEKGYLVLEMLGSRTLRAFNPVSGVLQDGVIADLENRDIGTLAVGPDGRVWVGLGAEEDAEGERGFMLLDPSDDSIVQALVPTEFNPLDVVFVDAPASDASN